MTCVLPENESDVDIETADLVIERLKLWHANTSENRPFFLAAGFQSPRLSWSYPAAVAARYPPARDLAVAKHRGSPPMQQKGGPQLEWFRPVEVDWYGDVQAVGGVLHNQPLADS